MSPLGPLRIARSSQLFSALPRVNALVLTCRCVASDLQHTLRKEHDEPHMATEKDLLHINVNGVSFSNSYKYMYLFSYTVPH